MTTEADSLHWPIRASTHKPSNHSDFHQPKCNVKVERHAVLPCAHKNKNVKEHLKDETMESLPVSQIFLPASNYCQTRDLGNFKRYKYKCNHKNKDTNLLKYPPKITNKKAKSVS